MTERELDEYKRNLKLFAQDVAELKGALRGIIGPRPLQRLVNRVDALRPQQRQNPLLSPVVDETPANQRRRLIGSFGILQQAPAAQNPEDQLAQEELRRQLVEGAQTREANEKAAEEKREAAANLERIRNDDFSGVQVSG